MMKLDLTKPAPMHLSLILIFLLTFTSPSSADSWRPLSIGTDWQPLNASGWAPMSDGWTALNTRIRNRSSAPSDYRAILDIIGRAESPRMGYNAVVYSARIKPDQAPTRMTIGQIYEWINQTPGQNHAIGRYQFIPATLRRVVEKAGLRTSQRFSESVQDRLAIILIEEAGFASWKAQRLSDATFMDNLARIWAGFPLANGRSAYHGHAGNRATVSRSAVQEALTQTPDTQPAANATPLRGSQGWVRLDEW